MKKLLLLILLSLSIYANKDIHRPKVVDMIRANLEKPLIYVENENKKMPKIPKVLITKDMYEKLFTYVKYLESENHMDEVNKIYLDTLQGLKNLKPTQFISLIFRISIEPILLESIKNHQTTYGLTKELKEKLKESLLINNNFLLKALNSEKNITLKLLQKSLLSNNQDELMPLVFKYQKEYMERDYQLQIEAIESGYFENLKKFRKKEKEEYSSTSTQIGFFMDILKVKVSNLIGLETDYKKVAQYLAKTLSLVAMPKVIETFKNYLSIVEKNKKFLEKI